MDLDRVASKEGGPKLQVLQHRERRLHRVLMAEIMHLLGDAELRIAPFEPKPAADRPDQSSDDPQQRGLPRAVTAGDGQKRAGSDVKAHAGKYVTAAAMAGQVD